MERKIKIYTDGSCNQEKKTGGWSFLMLENDKQILLKNDKEINTTNNKCEMLAAINGLIEFEKMNLSGVSQIEIISDSAYMVNGFNLDWISMWKANGWLNSEKKGVLNKELWETLIYFQEKYNVIFTQIKRRSDEYARKVDDMAKNHQ